ncbi:PFL_4703 family integrating conjugative element protein [Photobacterium leiognathi]|uniref:PFL_4703 family integrating conjugative element protein n=1 Tax=Photobacterium leiognathi TaxID=553611 RepID=UPI0029820F98|nr:TIGR03746 family integrating conjugative element protein [Photobacterium leiognathi]
MKNNKSNSKPDPKAAQPKSVPQKRSLPKKMHRFTDETRDHIKTLRMGGIGLAALFCITTYGLYRVPDTILLYQTPNLESGSTRTINEVPAYSVYSFGLYVMQQIFNTNDISSGLEKNVIAYGNYLSPEFAETLKTQIKLELKKAIATRDVSQEVREMEGARFDDQKVFQLSPNKWVVYLDLQIVNRVNSQKTKDIAARFPIVVEKADFDPAKNPTGLRITGYYGEPTRIDGNK